MSSINHAWHNRITSTVIKLIIPMKSAPPPPGDMLPPQLDAHAQSSVFISFSTGAHVYEAIVQVPKTQIKLIWKKSQWIRI